jgi:hypothetical protein
MTKRVSVALAVLFISALAADVALAQGTSSPPPPSHPTWRQKMFFGGGVGMGFGDVDFVSIEPLIGYRIDPKVSIGTSLLYRFTSDDRFSEDIDTHDYGARAFVQYFPVPQFFAQAEYEYLDYEYILPTLDTERDTAGSFFIGGGVSQPVGRNAAFFGTMLYNLSYDDNDPTSPYDSPWVVRIGIAAGF